MKDAPLREGLIFAGFLLLFVWPIHQLTARHKVIPSEPVAAAAKRLLICDVRFWSSDEMEEVEFWSGEALLAKFSNTSEEEFTCELAEGEFYLKVNGSWAEQPTESQSALGIELFAEGKAAKTLTLWGQNSIHESVKLRWDD